VARVIRSSPHLRLLLEPELSVVLFERIGWGAAEYQAWSTAMALSGRILCLPTIWQGRTVLRLAFVNPEAEVADVIAALNTLCK
jgi:hypothetical protein